MLDCRRVGMSRSLFRFSIDHPFRMLRRFLVNLAYIQLPTMAWREYGIYHISPNPMINLHLPDIMCYQYMGLSENRVPLSLNLLVNHHVPHEDYHFLGVPTVQTNPYGHFGVSLIVRQTRIYCIYLLTICPLISPKVS